MSKFVVAGITQIETIVKVDHIPIEYEPLTSVKHSIFTAPGGDAYNETLALKSLGNEVEFFSIVGRGQDLSIFNPKERSITVSTEYIQPVIESTPTQVILYDRERRQQIFEDIKDLRDAHYDIQRVEPLIAGCDMMVLANANFCRGFLEVAARYKRPIAVNIHDYRNEKEKYNTDFLSQASILYFSDDTIEGDPYDFIRYIADKYDPDIIILGQGSKGVTLYDKEKNLNVHYNTVKTAEVVNTAGAGNALIACFLHYYQETHDSVNSVKNALLFASYKIGYMGTSNGFMTVEQVEQWRNLIWRITPPQ